MIVGNYAKFCKDYHLCEGYAKAINSSEDYFLHHIQGENISREELKEKDLYYDCHHSVLKWVTWTEHNKIHWTGKTPWNKGKIQVYSEETIKKLSDAKKGRTGWWKGRTGPNKGRSWKLVNGKRIYSDSKIVV